MAIVFNNNFKIGIGAPIDSKYLNSLNQPYADVASVCSTISESQRYVGLTVLVQSGSTNVEYWFNTGTTNLVLKTTTGGGGSGTITGGINGLGVSGSDICLGGTLTSSTILTIGAGNTAGIEYAGSTTGFTDNSLINKGYVDGKLTGTTCYIPRYNSVGSGIEDSTLSINGNVLCNSGSLTIEVPNSCYIYFSAPHGAIANPTQNIVVFGKPTFGTGMTQSVICTAGQASNIGILIGTKGSGELALVSQCVSLGASSPSSGRFIISGQALRVPQSGKICGYGGDAVIPDAPFMCIVGGNGYSGLAGCCGSGGDVIICGGNAMSYSAGDKDGGDVIIRAGAKIGTGTTGNIRLCCLPAKTSEANVVYYNTTTGALSYGLASGGTGLITGGTNGIGVSGLNVCLGGTLSSSPVFDGGISKYNLRYAGDYSSNYTDRSLVDKGYVDLVNEKVVKKVYQSSHGFNLRDVIGFSGGSYNKAIADGCYNGEILGIVSCCYNADCFDLVLAGYVNYSGYSGFLTNQTYFLSDVTAGLLTYNEPTTLHHISKAMLIATSVSGGYVLPYAGYVISSGGTEGGTNGERITRCVYQTLHGFSVNDVVGWSAGQYTKAIADGTYNGEVIGLVTKVNGSDDFELTQSGYFSGLTGTSLSANTTYFLSDVVAGALMTTKPTTLGHIIRAVLVTTTATAGWILPYAGYILLSGSTVTGGTTFTTGLGLTMTSGNTLNVNAINMGAAGIPIPVKVCYGGGNSLYVDSADISGATFTGITGAANIGTGTGIYSGTSSNTLQLRSLKGSGNTTVSLSGNDIIIYSSGGTGGGGNTVTVCNIGTNYTATCDSDFIGVTGGTAICVTLPATPKPGQRITVSDVAGDALSDNIIICGNGRTIADVSCQIALINTNYGSMTFINNNTGTSWSAVAFIN